jgi:urease gamma subunit
MNPTQREHEKLRISLAAMTARSRLSHDAKRNHTEGMP